MRVFLSAGAVLAILGIAGVPGVNAQSLPAPVEALSGSQKAAQRSVQPGTESAKVDLLSYVPAPINGWKSDGLFDDMDTFDRSRLVMQEYSRKSGEDGGVSVALNLLDGAAKLLSNAKRRLGPDQEVAGRVTSEVDIGGFKGYLTFEEKNRTGRLEIMLGRCGAILEGHDVSSAELVAFARNLDVARISKI
jgi:hypothetical protein